MRRTLWTSFVDEAEKLAAATGLVSAIRPPQVDQLKTTVTSLKGAKPPKLQSPGKSSAGLSSTSVPNTTPTLKAEGTGSALAHQPPPPVKT